MADHHRSMLADLSMAATARAGFVHRPHPTILATSGVLPKIRGLRDANKSGMGQHSWKTIHSSVGSE